MSCIKRSNNHSAREDWENFSWLNIIKVNYAEVVVLNELLDVCCLSIFYWFLNLGVVLDRWRMPKKSMFRRLVFPCQMCIKAIALRLKSFINLIIQFSDEQKLDWIILILLLVKCRVLKYTFASDNKSEYLNIN